MEVSRRKFMLGVGAVAAAPAVLGDAQKVFRVGLVGCGGRGTGAIQNIMDAATRLGCKVELTATADFFPDKVTSRQGGAGGGAHSRPSCSRSGARTHPT